MPGGRPSQGKQQRYVELEELAAWFHQALVEAGFASVHEFLSTGLFEKNAVYGVFNASRLLTLESTQSLAVALKRNPAQVVDVWMRAKEARDRDAIAAQRAEQPRLSSWTDLPLPSLALRNLLEAQGATVERLPYSLLGVDEPPLSTVYVRQQVRIRAADERETDAGAPGAQRDAGSDARPDRPGPQPVLSVAEALERHDHLLVTGEPGAGKSTLSHHLARTLSLIWLRQQSAATGPLTEPVIPLRVSARSLDGTGSWSNVLAGAASRSLGRSLLQDPDPGMFAGRVQGARWLILVDGLDEIPDPHLRAEVVRAVAQHARSGSDYRFVITTRALPESELAPLRTGNVGDYVIQPFGRAELDQFARHWFAAQGVPSPDKEAERFLRETSDGRLRELVRNPLLATIAAVSAVKDPGRPLPTSRISLYERFCGYLSGDRGGGRNTLAQLRRHHRDDPDRLGCAVWLHSRRLDIVAALARHRLDGDEALWQAAEAWVRGHATGDVTLVAGWEDHLWEELIGTGLLVGAERELRFLHQSFAEFLSARSHASTLGDDPAELDAWIRRGLREAERTFALFTFAMWAGEPGHEITVVVDRLLASYDPQRVLLAGRLMAEGIRVDQEAAERIVDRLVALARNADFDVAVEAVGVLGALYDYPWVGDRVHVLAASRALPVARRMAAVVALEHLDGAGRARALLTELLPSCYGRPLQRAVPMVLRLGPSAVDEVRNRALRMVTEPDADTTERAEAAEVLRDLGFAADAEDMARSVFAVPSAPAAHLRRAAKAWHDAQGPPAVPEIARLALGRPEHDVQGKAELAEFLRQAGDPDTAAVLATAVLGDVHADAGARVDAAEVVLRCGGADGAAAVMDLVDRWSEPHAQPDTWHFGRLLKHVATWSPQTPVLERVRHHLPAQKQAIGQRDFIEAWLAAEGAAAAEEIMQVTNRGASLSLYDGGDGAEHLREAGAHAQAAEMAERVLRSPQSTSREYYSRAAKVLLKIDPEAGVAALAELGRHRPRPSSAWLAGLAEALSDHDRPDAEQAVLALAGELVAHPRADSGDLRDALLALLMLGEATAARTVAEAAVRRPELSVEHRGDLARALAAGGEHELAMTVWAALLSWQEYSVAQETVLLDDLLCAGVTDWATGRIRELIDDPATPARRRLRLRQMLGWLSASGD